jgi:N-acetylglucosaminyl-diphospho-decaprenol L-rhamnosyltransferase
MSPTPTTVDVLIVNFNTASMVGDMFAALRSAVGADLKLRCLVVDNASADDSVRVLRNTPDCELLVENRTNVGFGRANNQLLEHVRSEFVLLLNTDAFVAEDTLRVTIEYMKRDPSCGVLGVKLVGRDGALQPSCRSFPTPLGTFLLRTGLHRLVRGGAHVDGAQRDHSRLQECDWVPGCYYLVRRSVIDSVGLFDPRFFLYCEEVDHCKRVKAAGWKVMFLPSTTVVHIGGESARTVAKLTNGRQISTLQTESELLYFRKHHGRAGLAMHLVLSTLADLILATKDILKGRGVRAAQDKLVQCRTVWNLCVRTAWATQASR